MRTEHLLIIRFSAIGDVAMTVPLVASLAKQYPHLRITVLSRPFARAFFEDLAPNVEFMEADIKKEYRGVKGLNALYRRLVAKNFTAVADLHNILRSNYLRMRFNLGDFKVEHVNKHRYGKHRLVSQKNKKRVQQPTVFENYAEVFSRLGYPVEIDFDSIFNEKEKDKDSVKKIGIAPFAAHAGKIYPIEKLKETMQIYSTRHPADRYYIFCGRKNEMESAHAAFDDMPQCVFATDEVHSLKEELQLINQLDVMVSMDSANMHLASLTATPVVSIWGATHPYAGFMGWNQSIDNAVQLDMPCRPCSIYGKKKCFRGDYACLNNILPETIAEKIEKVVYKLENN